MKAAPCANPRTVAGCVRRVLGDLADRAADRGAQPGGDGVGAGRAAGDVAGTVGRVEQGDHTPAGGPGHLGRTAWFARRCGGRAGSGSALDRTARRCHHPTCTGEGRSGHTRWDQHRAHGRSRAGAAAVHRRAARSRRAVTHGALQPERRVGDLVDVDATACEGAMAMVRCRSSPR